VQLPATASSIENIAQIFLKAYIVQHVLKEYIAQTHPIYNSLERIFIAMPTDPGPAANET
jgi:hypothetical protein